MFKASIGVIEVISISEISLIIVSLFIASNTAGATGGKMISPQNIAIAASTVGLVGQEGDMLKFTIKYSIVYAIILGILVFIGSVMIA